MSDKKEHVNILSTQMTKFINQGNEKIRKIGS